MFVKYSVTTNVWGNAPMTMCCSVSFEFQSDVVLYRVEADRVAVSVDEYVSVVLAGSKRLIASSDPDSGPTSLVKCILSMVM